MESQPGPRSQDDIPGDVTRLTSRNIRGLYSNLAAALRGNDEVILLQEVDLAECNVADISAQAETAGYICAFGMTTQLDKHGREYGRRTAILVKGLAVPVDLATMSSSFRRLDDGSSD